LTCHSSFAQAGTITASDFRARSQIYHYQTEMKAGSKEIKISFSYDPAFIKPLRDNIYRYDGEAGE